MIRAGARPGVPCALLAVALAAARAMAVGPPVPVGTEFQVNTYTTSTQYDPAVASAGAGNFEVVWASEDQDGSEYGVFGQRYLAPAGGAPTPAPTLSSRALGVLALALAGFGARVLSRRRRHA